MKLHLSFRQLNVRGCQDKHTKSAFINDAVSYKLDILAINEHHILETDDNLEELGEYLFYHVGPKNSHHGVGLIIKKPLKLRFFKMSDRICKTTIQLRQGKLTAISAYAPTLQKCETNPTLKDEFYEHLKASIQQISKRDMLVTLGDFNAKTWASLAKVK